MLELVRFHFVWNAYETVRSISEVGCKMTTKIPEDRLSLFGAVPIAHKELLTWVYKACLPLAEVKPIICRRLKNGNEDSVLGKAGLLMAGFRDYVFHGEEPPPEPGRFGRNFQWDVGRCTEPIRPSVSNVIVHAAHATSDSGVDPR